MSTSSPMRFCPYCRRAFLSYHAQFLRRWFC
ncbi:hypothetical protein QUC31_019436 [Theobroma cacao]